MKNIYTWEIHNKYARYWTKESIEVEDTISNEKLYLEKMDLAEAYLSCSSNPHNLEQWNPPVIKEDIDEDEGILLKGDFHSAWGYKSYIVSQNMVDKMGDTLRKYGELFLLKVEDRKDTLYRYWATKEIPFKCVDKGKSKFFDNDYSDDDVFKIEKIVLKENCQEIPMIFRIKEEYKKTIFVSDDFIELIRKNDLKGFNFIPDTSCEYTNQGGSSILIG